MKTVRLYPSVNIKAQSFEKTKVYVVPNQAMTLREIITRFIRRQTIPGTRNDSYYSLEFGDLEKFRTLDFTEQEERIAEVSRLADRLYKRDQEEFELQKKLAIQKAAEAEKKESEAGKA